MYCFMETEHYNISLASRRENVSEIEPFLRSIPFVHEMPEAVYYNVLIVLTEAVNNAIIHGNECHHDKFVTVDVEVLHDRFRIVVADQGVGFDADVVPDPRRRENILKDGGRGVFLIRALADSVTFINTGSGMNVDFAVYFPDHIQRDHM